MHRSAMSLFLTYLYVPAGFQKVRHNRCLRFRLYIRIVTKGDVAPRRGDVAPFAFSIRKRVL